MWPVKVWLRQLHIPQRCRCDSHNNVFVDSERVAVFANHAAVLRHLSDWRTQQGSAPCFVYEVVKVERAGRDEVIEFN
jgi:hypothetical protein